MKYLRNDLREEYERIAKNVPDIEDLQHPLINFSDVLHAYFILADYFTDESSDNIEHMLVGLRSADLLGSALGRQIVSFATVYKGNIIKNLIMDCQSYTKYRPNETMGGIFVSWRRKEELPTGA